MSEQFVVAFDQGTTSTRTILFDLFGNIKGIAQRELTQYYPQSGWVEHDPLAIFEDQKATFEEVMQKSNVVASQIAAIGITNQRETTIVWDKKTGAPVYNAIVWLDNRTQSICNSLKQQGLEPYIKEQTGLVIDAYFSGTKLAWILDHIDRGRERAAAGELLFGTVDTWLIYNFTQGKHHLTDHTNASRTLLYNIKGQQWDHTILKALGIPISMLPSVQCSSSNFGSILFQNQKIPIYGVAGDQQAALFGQGGFIKGIAKNTYGTGCFMLLNTGEVPVNSSKGLLTTITCTLPNKKIAYALEGSIFIGGAAIQWLRDTLQVIDTAKATEQICFNLPPLEDVYVVPAFAGLGAPYWDPTAKGAMYGLTLNTGKDHIIKATIEAIALQSKDVIDVMMEESNTPLTSLKVDGGASINNYLMQFQANMLNVPVDRPQMVEVTALGAALLAGIKAGVWCIDDIAKLRKSDKLFKPTMNLQTRTNKYEGWKKAVARTRNIQ